MLFKTPFQNKCEKYWPHEENVTVRYGNFDVKLNKEEIWPDFCIRSMTVKKVRILHHFPIFKGNGFTLPPPETHHRGA